MGPVFFSNMLCVGAQQSIYFSGGISRWKKDELLKKNVSIKKDDSKSKKKKKKVCLDWFIKDQSYLFSMDRCLFWGQVFFLCSSWRQKNESTSVFEAPPYQLLYSSGHHWRFEVAIWFVFRVLLELPLFDHAPVAHWIKPFSEHLDCALPSHGAATN